MKNHLIRITIICCFLASIAIGQNASIQLQWTDIAAIPAIEDPQRPHPGLAGAFAGVHNNILIIAGGANFPNGPSWENGRKAYHQNIHLLSPNADGTYRWINPKIRLRTPTAYGLSIPTDDGLVCIGGMNNTQALDEVFQLSWQPESNELLRRDLPRLPVPLANLAGGKAGNTIYVAGSPEGSPEKYFWSFDLHDLQAGWQSLPPWPGPARTHAAGAIQNNGEHDCFFMIKGRSKIGSQPTRFLKETLVYDPKSQYWEQIPVTPDDPLGNRPLSAATAIPAGANNILVFGGDDGTIFLEIERLNATGTTEAASLRDSLMANHPGFSTDLLSFHTITGSWQLAGQVPRPAPVTTTVVAWDDQLILPSGEIAPCIRTPAITALSIRQTPSFGNLNTIILIGYLLVLIGFGLFFSRNQHTTEDFFKGGRRIPPWAAGISIAGTTLSAITFMAIPAKTFATDWLYFFLSMTIIMVGPFIIRIYLPFYRRFQLTTAYEYLELRFNLGTRILGSLMYLLLQLGRMGIVLLLPSLALSVVTGIDVSICILSMGVLSILYTVMGGIEAVVWTDVLQFFVLMGGALLSLVILYQDLDGAVTTAVIDQFAKMRVFDFSFDFTDATLWVVLLGGFSSNLITYGSDQTVVQRYLTTKTERGAARSISIGVWMALPTTLTFFSIGTLLFVFYHSNPELLNPVLEKTDGIYPWYIINSLPNGISGLLIAAIFAASMSSLDSIMNSVSSVVTTDYLRRFRPPASEGHYLLMARIITLVTGVAGTGIAIFLAHAGISSLWDQFQMIVGLFAGGLGGVFLLGMLSKRANGTGAILGLLLSGVLQFFIKEFTPVHFLLYAFTGLAGAMGFGALISMISGKPSSDPGPYTIYGLKK